MTKRRGMSMAEVLVALFLMALGSIAILTLFPLGMFHMGQALKDDRTAQSAAQADAFMRSYWRARVVESGNFGAAEPFVQAFDNADSNAIVNRGTANLFGAQVPSYPVFVDPMGIVTPWGSQNNSFQQSWVAYPSGVTAPGVYPNFPPYLPRRTLNDFTGGVLNPQRTCSLMDGFGFNEGGAPNIIAAPSTVERELRYNWLWVLQRPDNTVRTTATMTVVVFDKRAFQYAPANAEASVSGIGMQPLYTTVQVPFGSLAVQKGGWIMDASNVPPLGIRHAIFYRVVSVTDNQAAGTSDLELQTPIRRLDGSTTGYTGTLIYLAGVSEVFERPNLTPNNF